MTMFSELLIRVGEAFKWLPDTNIGALEELLNRLIDKNLSVQVPLEVADFVSQVFVFFHF
jgi:hypothetical protein